jgi:hypothetical protein
VISPGHKPLGFAGTSLALAGKGYIMTYSLSELLVLRGHMTEAQRAENIAAEAEAARAYVATASEAMMEALVEALFAGRKFSTI